MSSRPVWIGLLIAFLALTAVTFAGLFTWQYLQNQKDPETSSNSTNQTFCPSYPHPQPIDFQKHREFAELFEKLEKYLSNIVEPDWRPSVVANLVYRDQIPWSGYFGRVEKNSTAKPDQDTMYRVGSISKVFPTLYLYKLWEDGKLGLNDDLTKYAPDFSIGRPYGSSTPISLMDIASQTSGLPGSLPFDPLTGGSAIVYNGTLEEALESLRSNILVAEPRTKCYYSNLAYAILGHTLARNFTEDGDFNAWAQKNIIDVLDLKNTGLIITAEVKSKMAQGYYPNGNEALIYDLLWYGPAGNYYSSIGDLAKFSMSFLETSTTILKHETIVEMLRPRLNCRSGYFANYTGSPWEMYAIDSYMVVTKQGDIDGYSAFMAMVPDLKLSLNVMMSGSKSKLYIPELMSEIIPVFRDHLKKQEQDLTPAPNPQKYTGLYFFPPQFQNITLGDDGILYMENPLALPGRFKKLGLNYVSDGVLSLAFLGGEFPCVYNSLANLDAQNGILLHFMNLTNGAYNEFDMPEMFVYGFKRVQS